MLLEKFNWYTRDVLASQKSAKEQYRYIMEWSERARGTNPQVFDELSEWILFMPQLSEYQQVQAGIKVDSIVDM